MARLELSDLCFSVDRLDILRSVDLAVDEGKCLALLGPSGCGKTTTLRCIAGFIRPSAGGIAFNGHSVLGLPAHKRNVGLVFQDYALFPHLTVADNIAYGLRRRGVGGRQRRQRVEEALALVQLEGYADRMPQQLSGGQQQRVALARAMVIRPNVLLLDEPLGALDRKLRDQMQVELKRIQRETGTTTIIVTHDQEEALSLSDRVAVMFDGRIEEEGAPIDLYRAPRSRRVMEFLGSSNIFNACVTRANAGQSEVGLCEGVTFHIPGRHEEGRNVQIGIRPEQFVVDRSCATQSLNSLHGTISEVVYKGPHAELYIAGPGGLNVVVQRRIRGIASEDRFTIGEPVILSVEPDAIVVF